MILLWLTILFLPADATSIQASTPPCVGLTLPSVHGAGGDATATATSLRELLTSYLSGPKLRVIPLDSRLVVQALEEAREKDCAHVLTVTVTRKRSGGNGVGKALGRAASSAAWYRRIGRVGRREVR